MDIGFALNYQHIVELDITPGSGTRTWAWVGPGISTFEKDNSETVSEDAYYNNGGNTNKDVTGIAAKYNASGHRLHGDPAQDYVASLEDSIGAARKTAYRITDPTGKVVEADCTLTDIVMNGPNGEANSKTEVSFAINRDGDPRVVAQPNGSQLPDSVSVTNAAEGKITVVAESTQNLQVSVLPETASSRCLFAVEDTDIARVDANGVVTGVKAGTTRLAVKCAAKPSVSAMIEVEVTAKN